MCELNHLPATIRTLLQPDPLSTSLILTTAPLPIPSPNTSEHLIRVHACTPCNGELLWAKNFSTLLPKAKALVPCTDFAGTVTTSPAGSPFQPGDRVYARTSFSRPGCGREYTIATTEELAVLPRNLNWTDASAVPVSATTAWQMLFVRAGLGGFDEPSWKDRRLLVTAASGSVGGWVVQLARVVGAQVVGTCGPDNVDFVRGLGASEVLDYRTVDFRKWASVQGNKVDLVLDCVGGKSLEDTWWCVKDDGVLISIFQPPEQMKPSGFEGQRVHDKFFVMNPDGPSLAQVSRLIEEGKCKPILDSVFPFEKFEEAFARLAGGHARGKVVIDLQI